MGCYSSSTETDIFEENFNTSSYSENTEKGLVRVGDMLYRESDIVNTTYTDPAVHTMFSGINETPRDSEFQRAAYNIHFSHTASDVTNLSEQSPNKSSLNSFSYISEQTDRGNATFTDKATIIDSILIEQSDNEKATFINTEALNSPSLMTDQMDLERATFTNATVMGSHSFEEANAELEKATFTNATAMNSHVFVPEQADLEKATFTNVTTMNSNSLFPEQADLEKATFTNVTAMNSHSTVPEHADLKVTFTRESTLDSPSLLTEQTDCKKVAFTDVTVADRHPLVEEQAEKATFTNLGALNSSSLLEEQQSKLEKDTNTNTAVLSTDGNDLEKVTFTNELYANSFIKQRKQVKQRKISPINKASFTDRTEQMNFEKATLTNRVYDRIKCDKVKLPSDFVFIKPTNSPGKTVTIPRRKYSYQYDKTSSYKDFTDLQDPPNTKHVHIYDEIDIAQESTKPRRLAVNRTYMSLSDDCIFSVPNYFKKDNSFKRSSSSEVTPVYETIAPSVTQTSS